MDSIYIQSTSKNKYCPAVIVNYVRGSMWRFDILCLAALATDLLYNMSGVNLWECRRWRVGSHTLIFNDNIVGVSSVVKKKDEDVSTWMPIGRWCSLG